MTTEKRSTRSLPIVLALALMSLALPTPPTDARAVAQVQIPDLLENPEYSAAPESDLQAPRYLWVASDELFDESGNISEDPDLYPYHWRSGLSARVRSHYNKLLAGELDGSCLTMRLHIDYAPGALPVLSDLEGLVSTAHAMIRGRVVAARPGFLGDCLGIMLTVMPDGPLVRAPAYDSDGVVLVF